MGEKYVQKREISLAIWAKISFYIKNSQNKGSKLLKTDYNLHKFLDSRLEKKKKF